MTSTIGSFRDVGEYQQLLPAPLKKLLFETKAPFPQTFLLDQNLAHLNHGAFGSVYTICMEASTQLQALSEHDPALFFDKLVCPLLRNTVDTAQTLFKSENIFLIPNLTMGMKTLLTSLLSNESEKSNLSIAILEPIYGATRKLIQTFLPKKRYSELHVITVEPGKFEENPQKIIESLEASYATYPFHFLVADHVTSQTGRILPLKQVLEWCKSRKIILIVDGTQNASLLLSADEYPPYYLFSTHKWLCNVKTCGLLRCEEGAMIPDPCGISFGFDLDNNPHAAHLWIGMQDYIPHIVLALALQIYEAHGLEIQKKCSEMLENQLHRIGFPGVLPKKEGMYRMMNMIKVNRFDDTILSSIQDSLDMRNIRVSHKRIDGQSYLRISAFSYNSQKDFDALGRVLNYCLPYQFLSKEKLIQEFLNSCAMYDSLFEPVLEKGFFVRAERLRHHLIFYYGHTAVFYVNKLVLRGYLKPCERIDSLVESSCAVGVDEMSWDDLSEDNYPWSKEPARSMFVQRVKEYRVKVRDLVCNLITNYDFDSKQGSFTQLDFPWLILMGIEHSRIHIETSACIIHQLETQWIATSTIPPSLSLCTIRASTRDEVPKNRLISVPGGSVELGRSDNEHPYEFGWDNEFGSEKTKLEAFQVSEMVVSNAEFFTFMEDGGYATEEYWTEESWKWVQGMKRSAPLSWKNGGKLLRTLYEEIPMPWDWPVEVTSFEAAAFCAWKSRKISLKVQLISHEEWFLLRSTCSGRHYNMNARYFGSVCPVNMFGDIINEKGDYLYDLSGNVWQHTRSVLTLMEKGFKAHPAYDDFTVPTIDGNHFFIVGGSWISCGNPTHLNARYGFRRHFQQFAGIRYVVSSNDYHTSVQPYYTTREDCYPISNHYLDVVAPELLKTTFGTSLVPLPSWYRWFGQYAASHVHEEHQKIIFVNGSVGRSTLEFIKALPTSSSVKHILHTDYSAAQLRIMESLMECGKIRFDAFVDGDLVSNHYFRVDDHHLDVPSDISLSMRQLDPGNINPKFYYHDLAVVDADLPDLDAPPEALYASLVTCGGILIVASVKRLERISGYDVIENDIRRWKLTRETGRVFRMVDMVVSVWKRNDQPLDVLLTSSHAKRNDHCVPYQCEETVEAYEAFHYGPAFKGLANFNETISHLAVRLCKEYSIPLVHALDVGCGPGRTAIELVKIFTKVTAVDWSSPFVDICKKRAASIGIPEGHELVTMVGDAHKLPVMTCNLILAVNVIDRFASPRTFLERVKEMMNVKDCLLIVASPFTWLEEFTSKEEWLGGVQKWAENYSSSDALVDALAPLSLLHTEEIPFVQPNGDGSFQFITSHLAVFRLQ